MNDQETGTEQAAGTEHALGTLLWNWGEAYDIGCDAGQWWYRRKDGKGGRETAASADELYRMIVADYTFMPVPRDLR